MDYLGLTPGATVAFWTVIGLIGLWEAVWKAIALWKCGRNRQLVWFIFIFIFNTAGILPIIYLIFFQRKTITERAAIRQLKRKRRK